MSSRAFPASRESLFAAFADVDRLARWWGPHGSTSFFEVFEPRPGGRWRIEMRTPGGALHRMEKTFLEYDPPRRIVVQHHQQGHEFTLAMEYEEIPSGTRLVWRARFATSSQLAAVAAAFAEANEQNFDRLAVEIARTDKT